LTAGTSAAALLGRNGNAERRDRAPDWPVWNGWTLSALASLAAASMASPGDTVWLRSLWNWLSTRGR